MNVLNKKRKEAVKVDEKAVPIALEIEKDGEYYYIAVDSDKTTDDILSVARKKNSRLADFEQLGRRIGDREYTEFTQSDSVILVTADLDNREVSIFDENDVLTSISLDESIEEQAVAGDHELTFAEQVEAVLNHQFGTYSALKVSDTPKILLDVGCEQLPILYTQQHLRDALHEESKDNSRWHGLTVAQIKALPEYISAPAIVMDSLSRNDSIVIISNTTDNKKRPLIATIKPNGKGVYGIEEIGSNFVTSLYGRNGIERFIQRAIVENKILFASKNKTEELFKFQGLQLPEAFNNLPFDSIIHQSRNIVKGLNKTFQENKEEKTMAEITLSQEQLQELIQNAVSSAIKPVQEQLATVQAELGDIRKNQKVIQAFMTAATAAKDFTQVMEEVENVTKTMTGAVSAKFYCLDNTEDKFFSQNEGEKNYRSDDIDPVAFSAIRAETGAWNSYDEWHVFGQEDGSVLVPVVSNDGRFMGIIKAEGEFSADKSEFEGYRPESEILNTIDLALQKETEHQGKITDELTGLKNRDGLNEYITEVIAPRIQEEKPVVIIMCDIDHFKSVNDTYGHDAGDVVLANVAQILRGETRTGDDGAFRFGGEEMICVMNCEPEQAYERAEKIRREIEGAKHTVTVDGKETEISVTISMGVYQIDPSMTKEFAPDRSQAELREAFDAEFKNADNMVYQSKENGRNRITTSPEIYDKVLAGKAADLMHIERYDSQTQAAAMSVIEESIQQGQNDVVMEAVADAPAEETESLADDLAQKSRKTYSTAEKIGTVPYGSISDKYKTDGITEEQLGKLAERLEADNIGYSGVKRRDGTYTVTVERADEKAVKAAIYSINKEENMNRIADPAYINGLDRNTVTKLTESLKKQDIPFAVKTNGEKYNVIVERKDLNTAKSLKSVIQPTEGKAEEKLSVQQERSAERPAEDKRDIIGTIAYKDIVNKGRAGFVKEENVEALTKAFKENGIPFSGVKTEKGDYAVTVNAFQLKRAMEIKSQFAPKPEESRELTALTEHAEKTAQKAEKNIQENRDRNQSQNHNNSRR